LLRSGAVGWLVLLAACSTSAPRLASHWLGAPSPVDESRPVVVGVLEELGYEAECPDENTVVGNHSKVMDVQPVDIWMIFAGIPIPLGHCYDRSRDIVQTVRLRASGTGCEFQVCTDVDCYENASARARNAHEKLVGLLDNRLRSIDGSSSY
jgi:hypothetical protein